jgi:hypothetical protein
MENLGRQPRSRVEHHVKDFFAVGPEIFVFRQRCGVKNLIKQKIQVPSAEKPFRHLFAPSFPDPDIFPCRFIYTNP